MDLDEVLNKLIKKYEYIDFEDKKVLECFNKSVEDIKNKNDKESSILIELDIEYHFIHYIILEIKNGNQELYDALSIAYEKVFDFYINRHKEKVKNISKERLKELYNLTFKNAINEYYELSNFQSKLISNLSDILTYKNENHLESDDVDMKKSLYDEFEGYDKDLVNLVVKSLKNKEAYTYALFIKRYGANFNGENNNVFLPYHEASRLSTALMRYREYVRFASALRNEGKSDTEIKKTFQTKRDADLINMMKNYSNKDKKKNTITKKDILKEYKITEGELIDALDSYDAPQAIKIFKMYYGIGEKKLTDREIAKSININLLRVKECLESISNNLPKIIKEYLDYMNEYNKNEDKKEILLPQTKRKTRTNQTFFEGIIDENIEESEKESLENKIIEYVNSSEESIRNFIIKLYGKDLKHRDMNIILTKNERMALTNYRKTLKDRLKRGILEYKCGRREKNFFSTLIDESLSEIEKDSLKKDIIKYLKLHGGRVVENIFKLYGENLDQYNDDLEISTKELKEISLQKAYIHKKIKKNNLLYTKDKITVDYFKNFFDENITQDEIEKLKKKVVEYINSSNVESYILTRRLFGDNLDSYDTNLELTLHERQSISSLRLRIKRELNSKDDLWHKRGILTKYFYQMFTKKNDLTPEEINELQEKITLVFNNMDGLDTIKSYITSMYGNDLNDELNTSVIIPKEYLSDLAYLKKRMKALIKKVKDVKNDINKNTKRYVNKDLFSYFIREEVSLEERELIISSIINRIKNSNHMYEIYKKAYGEDLTGIYNPTILTVDERKYISSTKQTIYIQLKKGLLFKPINGVENLLEIAKPIEENIVYVPPVEEKIENNSNEGNIKLNYIDSIILTMYETFSIKSISIILTISVEEVIKSLMRSLNVNPNIEKIIDNLLDEYPEYLNLFLESDYMNELMSNLTEQEQKLIYLKFKSINNKAITNSLISDIIDVPIKDIEDYVVYAEDAKFDFINKMLKKLK